MPRSALAPGQTAGARKARLRLVSKPPLRIADVALFYGERSGGIRTYLEAKRAYARDTGAIAHHLVVPGPVESHEGGVHTLPSLRMATTNGYRIPLGARSLRATLRTIKPDIVLLHDPFWGPLGVTRTAHRLGAHVIAVHHGSSALDAAALPGPSRLYKPLLRAWLRRAYAPADALMSASDPGADRARRTPRMLPLRLGVDPAFRPRTECERGDHVLYAGRLAREKGVCELLGAAAGSSDPWPLVFIGSGPMEGTLRARAAKLGIAQRVSFRPFLEDRDALARAYASARCVVMPGPHETFGLVALEAAACGARVVACEDAPGGRAAGSLAHRFAAGDVDDLGAAIAHARRSARDLPAAALLAERHGWTACFERERADLEHLLP